MPGSIALHDWRDIKHFTRAEFACPCCGRSDMDLDFVRRLDRVRERLGRQLVVLSGFRCAERNRRVGGVADSAHLRGLAADLRCEGSRFRLELLDALRGEGFVRLGLASYFLHVDADPGLTRNVLWIY